MYKEIPYRELVLKNGGRLDIWIRNIEFIEGFIKNNKLAPVAKEHLPHMMPIAGEMEPVKAAMRRWDIRGGIRMPHIHSRGEIFLLNDMQWTAFSKQAVKEFQERLASVKTVNFDSMAELSEAIYANT